MISIHALREEGDRYDSATYKFRLKFLSTPSARRATILAVDPIYGFIISIHALREEGDEVDGDRGRQQVVISIHALREEGDLDALADGKVKLISIHALREEGDSKNGEKHLHFCFIIKRSAQIWKSLSKNIRKKSRDLHRTA